MTSQFPVAIIGAGPVGLAAAAHLLGRGLDVVIFERADDVAASQRAWGHVRLFSPWRYNIDRAAAALLETTGWIAPPLEDMPTGRDLVDRYLQPLSMLPVIRQRLRLGRRVEAITRVGMDKVRTAGRGDRPFSVRTRTADGVQEEWSASAVIDASGTWFSPNPLGASGLPALNEGTFRDRITYGIPDVLGADRARYADRTTMVVGAGLLCDWQQELRSRADVPARDRLRAGAIGRSDARRRSRSRAACRTRPARDGCLQQSPRCRRSVRRLPTTPRA